MRAASPPRPSSIWPRSSTKPRKPESFGIGFGKPELDLDAIRGHKEKVIGTLTKGSDGPGPSEESAGFYRGRPLYLGSHPDLLRKGTKGKSSSVRLLSPRVPMRSGCPSSLRRIPASWTRPGPLSWRRSPAAYWLWEGGIIGMEMATIYSALGTEVTVVELTDQIIPPADPDLAKPLLRIYKKKLKGIHTSVAVSAAEAQTEGILVSFKGEKAPEPTLFDRVLVSVGRRPNSEGIGPGRAGAESGRRRIPAGQ